MTFDWLSITPTYGNSSNYTLEIVIIRPMDKPRDISIDNRNYILASDAFISSGHLYFGLSIPATYLRGKTVQASCDVEIINATKTGRVGYELGIRRAPEGNTQYAGFCWKSLSVGQSYSGRIASSPVKVIDDALIFSHSGCYVQLEAEFVKVGRPKLEILDNANGIWNAAPEDLWTRQKTFEILAPEDNKKACFTVTHKGPAKQFSSTEFNPLEFY